MKRLLYDTEHENFRATVAAFVAKEVAPHWERWDDDGIIDRSAWTAAGALGLIGIAVPEAYGGGGVPDFRYRMVVMEELCRVGANSVNAGLSVQDDLVVPYLVDLGTEQQRHTRLCAGTAIGSLALTEPGAGSDLRGIQPIYGGTNEIMKDIVGRDVAARAATANGASR
ncbi:acyl-CoA dehydrogenase family protein [Nocardia sp. NPDC055053]